MITETETDKIFNLKRNVIKFTKKEFDNLSDSEIQKMISEEIELIADNFTAEEINKLRVSEVDGDSPKGCIYGVMTGDCNSDRVSEFIKNNINYVILNTNKNPSKFSSKDRTYNYFTTPVEEYIIPVEYYDFGLFGEYSSNYNNKVRELVDRIIKTKNERTNL